MVTIFFASLFGNLETADLFLVAPTLFLDAAYSRQFEIEADRYAFEKMNMHKIELSHFKSILNKLEDKVVICDIGANCGKRPEPKQQDTGENILLDYLSSHPLTGDRIALLEEYR